MDRGKTMLRCLTFLLVLGLTGCFGTSSSSDFAVPSFSARLQDGDRHMAWALTYFQSWRRDRQSRYLFLAEEHTYEAVEEFATLQMDTSPRINEFYVVRERRVRSCRFLAELQFNVVQYGLGGNSSPSRGCTF